MLLYLMRHGVAIDRDDPKCPREAERFLTPDGLRKTREVAKGMLKFGIRPQLILTSPYVRARQTADIVAEVLGVPPKKIVESAALLPDQKPGLVMRALSSLEVNKILCVGHAPSLDYVAAHILGFQKGERTHLKKAGVIAFEVKSLLSPRGTCLWHFPPKALRLMA